MGEVCGKGFDEADALLQALEELLQSARQIADLIPTGRATEAPRDPAAAIQHGARLPLESAQGACDGGRHQEAQHHRHRHRGEEDLEDREPHLVEVLQQAQCGLRNQRHAHHRTAAPDRNRTVEGHGALTGTDPGGGAVASRQGRALRWC